MSDPSDNPTVSRRSIGRFFAAVGVVLSLLFVGWEIRQNTAVARSDANSRTTQALSQLWMEIATDPNLFRVWSAWQEGRHGELDSADVRRLGMVLQSIMGLYEDAYIAGQYGVLGGSELSRFDSRPCSVFRRARPNSYLFGDVSGALTDEFVNYLESSCE